MKVIRASHTSINCYDLEQCITWYTQNFKLDIAHTFKNVNGRYGVFLDTGNGTLLELFKEPRLDHEDVSDLSLLRHICFEVADIREAAEELAIPITDIRRGRTDRVLQCFVKDPNGIEIELQEHDAQSALLPFVRGKEPVGRLLNIMTPLHERSKRDCFARMDRDKPRRMEIAMEYGDRYWNDPEGNYGYKAYKYIPGYWTPVAQQLIDIYKLGPGSSVLDVGCGKGFLLHEMKQLIPELHVLGIDVSTSGLLEVPKNVDTMRYRAQDPYPFGDKQFDLVISLATLHNLKVLPDLRNAVREIERVGKQAYVMVESWIGEEEKTRMMCWALTCQTFMDVSTWIYTLRDFGYTKDYEFIRFKPEGDK